MTGVQTCALPIYTEVRREDIEKVPGLDIIAESPESGVIIVLPIACAYPFFQRYIVAGLTVGSVKG